MELTESAVLRMGKLLTENSEAVALRVGVVGGGCNGFNYTFSFTDEILDGDTIVRKDNVTVVIDPMSLMYLEDATIDYVTSLQGDQFVVDNPAATTTCGCGQSFTV